MQAAEGREMNLTHEFRVISREDIELDGVGTVVDEVEWEFVFTPTDPEYAEYTHTETGVTFLDEETPETALLASEATNEKIEEWVVEQEGGQNLFDDLINNAQTAVNQEIINDLELNNRMSLVTPLSTPDTKENIEVFDELLVKTTIFSKGSKSTMTVIPGTFRYFDEVSKGDWISSPFVGFTSNGKFLYHGSNGRSYSVNSTMDPRKMILALDNELESLDDQGVFVTISSYQNLDFKYDSYRKLLAAGEETTISATTDTFLYVCQGQVRVNVDTFAATDLCKIGKDNIAKITAISDANIVVIHNKQEYQFYKTSAEPRHAKEGRVN